MVKVPKPPTGIWDRFAFGLSQLHDAYDKGKDLPEYLVDAVTRYGREETKRIDRQFALPKVVGRKAKAGMPKSRKTKNPKNAFQVAGEVFNMSAGTVEREYLKAKRKAGAKGK